MNLRVMHVVVNLEVGGVQTQLLDLADAMPGITTSVAAVTTGGDLQPEFERRGPTIILGNELNDPHRSYTWFSQPRILRLGAAMRKLRPDVVQTHHYPAAIVGCAAAKLAGVPVIVNSYYNTYYWKEPKDLRIDRLLARWADRTLCCSRAVREFALQQNPRLPADKFQVQYLGVDTERFRFRDNRAEARRRFDLESDDIVVGFVARLVSQKRPDDLIDAAAKIVPRVPQARFVVAGDGPLRADLVNEVSRRGLTPFFRFPGVVLDPENLYPALDVVAQLAGREGFGLSMAESLACGTAVVGANTGSIPEVIKHGLTGLIFEVGDIGALVEAICSLLLDPARREVFGRQAEIDIRERFPITRAAATYPALYRELLAQKE